MPPKSKTTDPVQKAATPEQQPEAVAAPTQELEQATVQDAVTPGQQPEALPVLSVSVSCTRAQGIWRAGRYWPAEAVTVELDAFTDEQWQQIEAEPLLRIRVEG